jgi:hypothetical protein
LCSEAVSMRTNGGQQSIPILRYVRRSISHP